MNFREHFSEYFAGINFRELGFTEDFAGINFRELSLTKDFAGINFRESAFSDFPGVNLTFAKILLKANRIKTNSGAQLTRYIYNSYIQIIYLSGKK